VNNIEDFKAFLVPDDVDREEVMTLHYYKNIASDTYSYKFSFTKDPDILKTVTEDFITFCLINTVRDIMAFSGDPLDIELLVEEILGKVGFDNE